MPAPDWNFTLIYTHQLYSESSTRKYSVSTQTSHFTLSLSLSSKSKATFLIAHHRNRTGEIIGWGHLLQPHYSWKSLANETAGPTTPLHPNMGHQLHWWNFSLITLWWNCSLPTLWLPLVFLQSSQISSSLYTGVTLSLSDVAPLIILKQLHKGCTVEQ